MHLDSLKSHTDLKSIVKYNASQINISIPTVPAALTQKTLFATSGFLFSRLSLEQASSFSSLLTVSRQSRSFLRLSGYPHKYQRPKYLSAPLKVFLVTSRQVLQPFSLSQPSVIPHCLFGKECLSKILELTKFSFNLKKSVVLGDSVRSRR